MTNEQFKIATYLINLKKRTDRKEYILNEFANLKEFEINVVEASEHPVGAIGLWNTIKNILQDLVNEKDEFILICEDDHQFTPHYSKEYLIDCIEEAKEKDANILAGGVSWFQDVVPISDKLLWMKRFTGTQFIIIFRKFFKTIIEADFTDKETADSKISSISATNFFVYPFLSVQKEFGYSDATLMNNQAGRIEELFQKASESVQMLKAIESFYNGLETKIENLIENDLFENTSISTYIIYIPELIKRRNDIYRQFEGKGEFDIKFVAAVKHKTGKIDHWESLRTVVKIAIKNDDDVAVICWDNHEFTEHYSKKILIKNILEAHSQGVDYLSGSTTNFEKAIPITPNRFWVYPGSTGKFIVVYKKFFYKILCEPFDEKATPDMLLPQMTGSKMVFFPFISDEKDNKYSDVEQVHSETEKPMKQLLAESSERLENIMSIYCKYKKK